MTSEFSFLQSMPRFVFFTGKGGVGKTSLACATATRLADSGKRVLLVSTDPASNVGQVFGQSVGNRITPMAAVPGLDAIEIDPEQAADLYRERIISPMLGVAPAEDVAAMTESLSGSCTTEIASFNEFTDLLADDTLVGAYDHVVFDTAPTGHTIRLLQLPGEWAGFLAGGAGASCLGPMAGMDKARHRYVSALERLADPAMTRLVLVARAQPSALAEAARTAGELAELGITEQHLVVNAVLPDPSESGSVVAGSAAARPSAASVVGVTSHAASSEQGIGASADPLASAVFAREQRALASLPDALAALPTTQVPLRPAAVMGVKAVRSLLAPVTAGLAPLGSDKGGNECRPSWPAVSDSAGAPGGSGLAGAGSGEDVDGVSRSSSAVPDSVDVPGSSGLAALIDELAGQKNGLVLCMGKGGVGKTSVAAAIALALAEQGKKVHLSTTDPAAHLDEVLAGASAERLAVSRIDAHAATEAYRERVVASKGKGLDADALAALEEDLRSPCYEEVAVFGEFAHLVSQARRQFVVIDTAPTGHTLLLLDTTGSYHREITRNDTGMRQVTPLMRLQDPELTKLIIVTLPEATPVLEAEGLQADLARAEITPWAWVVNQSLAAANPTSPLLAARAAAETPQLARVRELSPRVAVLPLLAEEPTGAAGLHALTRQDQPVTL